MADFVMPRPHAMAENAAQAMGLPVARFLRLQRLRYPGDMVRLIAIRQAAAVVASSERLCLQRARRSDVHGAREPRLEWHGRATVLHAAKLAILDLLGKP